MYFFSCSIRISFQARLRQKIVCGKWMPISSLKLFVQTRDQWSPPYTFPGSALAEATTVWRPGVSSMMQEIVLFCSYESHAAMSHWWIALYSKQKQPFWFIVSTKYVLIQRLVFWALTNAVWATASSNPDSHTGIISLSVSCMPPIFSLWTLHQVAPYFSRRSVCSCTRATILSFRKYRVLRGKYGGTNQRTL